MQRVDDLNQLNPRFCLKAHANGNAVRISAQPRSQRQNIFTRSRIVDYLQDCLVAIHCFGLMLFVVANAYIVYALSESGVNVDIEKEYQHALDDALKTNDTYKMALLACASFNLGKNENAKTLISKIKENIETYNFPAIFL